MKAMSDRLREMRLQSSAGGGMVEIETNGLLEVLSVKLDPELVARQDRELMEDLLVAAMNQAITKAKQAHAEEIRSMTNGLEIPGLDQAMGTFFGTAGPPDTQPS
ncbi:MAG: YbaB/EbfC family nucleoid-associated protein [Planctomycetota bacterium]|nr:MAG: YbaB/EbfC family nucleoid-associated protein [Planctomycetota bacterium]